MTEPQSRPLSVSKLESKQASTIAIPIPNPSDDLETSTEPNSLAPAVEQNDPDTSPNQDPKDPDSTEPDDHQNSEPPPTTNLNDPTTTTDTPTDIHEQTYILQQSQRKAALIQQLLDKSKISKSYIENSKKENQVLLYVNNFNRQYTQLFPGRKELLLAPCNEFGIKKFICTTIRPTQLPYKEFYDYRSCAKIISEYLNYEPLDPPHELPQTIPSPTYTLSLQSGTSFDYSILLTSLLRGVGYDAYIVSGYATREITLMDESRTNTWDVGLSRPFSDEKQKVESVEKKVEVGNKYKVKPTRQLKSVFLERVEEKKRNAEKLVLESLRKKEEEKEKNNVVEDDDELKGLRVHAWVLILPGKREIAEPFFIEPSTGRIYQTDNENFLGVESVASSNNYWVNMQVCSDGLKGISFDLGDNTKWEFVLLGNTQPSSKPRNTTSSLPNEKDPSSDDEDDENGNSNTEYLDLPPSWVDKFVLTKEQFESRCPSGSKCVTYKNARVETFADYHRADGMISRITFFMDEKIGFHGEIQETFENRRDKLIKRIRIPYTDKIHEFFDPGRPLGLKEHIIVAGKTTEMHFYSSARSDGLVKRLEFPHKVIEHFTDREDLLVYRSVTYDISEIEEGTNPPIIKMTEKFDRNESLPAHEDPQKKTYFLKDEKIRIIYHREKGRIIASSREFKKPTAEQKGNILDFSTSFEVNPFLKPLKKQHLYALLSQLLKTEQACLQSIKSADREIKEILQARVTEEKDVSLVISVYDTIRNNTNLQTDEIKDSHKNDDEEIKSADLDYLSPFLVAYPNQSQLSREDAISVKEACLKSLKERLIEKANIIQGRLDDVTAEYQRQQLLYSRNADSMTVEETEDYVNFCNDALFKIHILEKRLAKHKESAPEKYIELDGKLKADPRLQNAFA